MRDDAAIRAQTVAHLEQLVGRDSGDQITPRMLAAEYLQRYRERGDIQDVLRAQAMAQRSLRIQPQGNVAALRALAGAQLTLHQFQAGLATVRAARRWKPDDLGLAMFEASLDLELGRIEPARALLARFGNDTKAETETIAARLDELTGHLADGRRILAGAARRADTRYELPAERRAWFHVRLGEMAFAAGDTDEAVREERIALSRFSDDTQAWTDLARFDAALGAWSSAEEAAARAVALVPSPENLGLLADAQIARGDAAAAAATRDEILAVEKLGNTQHIVDRLLAMEEADHGVRVEHAYRIARREVNVRDDVYAEDTLAWCAARAGHWDVARSAIARATRWGTEDGRLWYHAGFIAEHDGLRETARQHYQHALRLNPHFQAGLADDARLRLIALGEAQR
jgi:tetratricopeptide (TPR) repeat protein